MKRSSFIVGVALGAVLGGAGGIYLLAEEGKEPVLMPRKHFFDTAREERLGDGYISVSGALSGAGIGNPNNHYSIVCFKDRGSCDVITYESIGHNHVGTPTREEWKILRWEPSLVVVDSDPAPDACSRVTLNLLRDSEEAQYVRHPMNVTAPNCDSIEMKVFRWHIDDPPYWRRADAKQ